MGMILTCSRDALPGEAAAFLILDYELRVSAVSEAGERFFGKEKTLIGAELLELVTSPLGDDQLGTQHVGRRAAAVRRHGHAGATPQPADTAGKVGTMAARIATCGPPRAALLTVEPSEFGRR